MASGGDEDKASPGPRTWYYGHVPWSGDDDFMAWQRRKRSLNRWDAMLGGFALLSVPAGSIVWRLTGSRFGAVSIFGVFVALACFAALRKWHWEHTGNERLS